MMPLKSGDYSNISGSVSNEKGIGYSEKLQSIDSITQNGETTTFVVAPFSDC